MTLNPRESLSWPLIVARLCSGSLNLDLDSDPGTACQGKVYPGTLVTNGPRNFDEISKPTEEHPSGSRFMFYTILRVISFCNLANKNKVFKVED